MGVLGKVVTMHVRCVQVALLRMNRLARMASYGVLQVASGFEMVRFALAPA